MAGLTLFHIREYISYMEYPLTDDTSIDRRIARRLKHLRTERGWSLDDLAKRSTVSRATLSRLENAEVSPTASVLGKLCAAHGLTMSRLMHMVEGGFQPLLSRNAQALWTDPETGLKRRAVSPPAETLAGEALECELQPGTRIAYDAPPRPGLEHHLVLMEGELEGSVDGQTHALRQGGCLRDQLFGASAFRTPDHTGARYIIFIV